VVIGVGIDLLFLGAPVARGIGCAGKRWFIGLMQVGKDICLQPMNGGRVGGAIGGTALK
jgi:hypothetical protein